MSTRKMLTASLLVTLGLTMASSIGATDTPKKTSYLTFSGSVQIPGKVLGAGTYIFELPDSGAWDLVRVSSRDRKTVYLTAFTQIVQRPDGMTRNPSVTFGEAAKGTPPPVQAWYPQDEPNGRAFIY